MAWDDEDDIYGDVDATENALPDEDLYEIFGPDGVSETVLYGALGYVPDEFSTQEPIDVQSEHHSQRRATASAPDARVRTHAAINEYGGHMSIDVARVFSSSRPLAGAMGGVIDGNVTRAHIPGYGLTLCGTVFAEGDVGELATQLKDVLFGLAGTVKGLGSNDLVGLAVDVQDYSDHHTMVVVQMVPGDPDTLEVVVNGSTV